MNDHQLIKEWADAWSTSSKQRFLAIFADDCIYEDVAAEMKMKGKPELGGFFDLIRQALPDFKVFEEVISLGEGGGTIQWHMTGTHKGALFDRAATHKEILVRGVCVIKTANSKIIECTDYYNMATLFKQLGFKDQ
ncbi:SnoaL-like domain-containing protein [Pseudomonas sp. WS 5059]|uniref:ester cyclase n=1 Tax=Pseudomonas sp. WS 5059 TaxID=2717491 RepID=UPI00147444FC|nr:ester cyclase [Pseudomonas sp. WS 5059]NMY05914.1 SnoaL-like domain-containing protein [Pseudomonas sp. WS 5059]